MSTITIKQGSTVIIETVEGKTITATVKVANPIEGLRIRYRMDKFKEPVIQALVAMSTGRVDDIDLEEVITGLEEMCDLLNEWVYELEGVDLETIEGTSVTWKDMNPEQRLSVIQCMPMMFMDLFKPILGIEESIDLGKSEEPPTLETPAPQTQAQ